MIQWGTISLAKDSAGAVSYSPDFSSFAIPIASATVRLGDDSQQDNSGYATGTSTKTGFTMYNASDFSKVIPWLAVGVCSMRKIGRASGGNECVRTGRSRWSPYH